ncbi:DUF3152 domain-containing protein [Paractinoplanes ferrugineus]|uniref:Lipoprotein n=1 Tax=Paractinoplanes ferrugineus TaxID=113564 RepID=A0A919J0P4_9ACTN|nr:DUF3152 domain-containing protein [Actinoplanes ferrugineus]GIE10783.1 lipoprotein [Actinoplanes ferrugineus]
MAFRSYLPLVAVLLTAGCVPGPVSGRAVPPATAPGPLPMAAEPRVSPAAPPRITYPANGHGNWLVAPPAGGTAGDAGRLMRYRVAVESDIKGLSPAAFARTVAATLGAPQGWTAGGKWRFRQVGAGDSADFTVRLVTPDTRDRLCDDVPDGYTSCRNGSDVVLNVARWVKGVPGYGATLAVYRAYMVNHEVGHRLGDGHELCSGPGEAAPVMQQQTLGLHGCTANPWPYRAGHRHAGRSGQYDDDIPPPDQGRK